MKEQVVTIVAAFVKGNRVGSTELPALIASVSHALDGLVQVPAAVSPAPAVLIRQSIRPDYLVCLVCAHRTKILKRHLIAHDMTPAEYRSLWGLRHDYPMTAPNYSAQRSEVAKSLELGQRFGRRGRR
jgi:predicted transcriptional regulator